MKRCAVLCSFCVLSLLVFLRIIWSAESEAPKQAPATYVGNEVCQACHAPAFEKFSQTMMGKIFLFNPRDEREKRACENCHGPGSNHAAAGGGKGVGGMITFRKDSGESAKSPERSLSRLPSARQFRLTGKRVPTRTAG